MNTIGLLHNLLRKAADATAPAAGQTVTLNQLINLLNLGDVPKDKLSEATYFTCLKILSEAVGKLPLKLLKSTAANGIEKMSGHPLYGVVKYRPNPYMTSSSFWGTVEFQRNHYGNAYCLITGAGSRTRLWILSADKVRVWYDDACLLARTPNIWYIYSHGGKQYKFGTEEILHFKTSTTADGITGLSVAEMLQTTLEGNQKAQKMLNGLYDSGFVAKAVLQYTGNLNDDLAKTFAKGIENFALGRDEDIRSIIPIPYGANLQPLNMKLTDAEFLGVKKYSALQIAAAFGIKPNQINDYEKSSYASAEAQQLAFYVDTLLFILKQYEEETTYKLLSDEEIAAGMHFKFNVSVILRADLKTQIDSLSTAVSNGIYTPNEARALLDYHSKPGGDELLCNGSMIPVGKAGLQYERPSG